jgi:hypothetical protein
MTPDHRLCQASCAGRSGYREMQEEYARVHKMLGAKPGQCVQMLVRLGHGQDIGKTPRWPLANKLIS